MSDRNYWTNLRQRKISRRTMLGASAKAGVGAAGLALVGCGGGDDDAAAEAAAAQAAAEAAADAADAARAAGDAGAAAVAQAAADAAGAAAAAAREAGAADTAAAAAVAVVGEAAEFTVPWPLDQVDLDASIVGVVPSDQGGLDQHRAGSVANYYSHGAVFNAAMAVDPRDGSPIPELAAPEWIDAVTIRAAVVPAPFHDGSILTAHDMVFTFDRKGGLAEYHQGGETSDHPGGWAPWNPGRSSALNWVRNEAVDDRTWSFELPAPDAGLFTVNLASTFELVIMSQADTERRGDAAVDQAPMGTGPYRFVSHEDDTDFVFERFEDHFRPVDHPLVVSHYAHNKHLKIVVRPEVQSRLADLEAGEIDTVPELGPDHVKPFLDDPDFAVQFQPVGPWTIQVLYPNLYAETLADGSPNPLLDIRVRQAANHAINRAAIIDNLFVGQGEYPLFSFSGVQGYPTPEQKQEVQYDYDPERARQLLAEAGYPDGFDIPLFWTSEWGGPAQADLALAVAQDLTTVGIRPELKPLPFGEYLSDAYLGGAAEAPAGLYWFWSNVVRDVGSMWDCCVGPGGFFTIADPQDPSLHELYLAQKAEQDPERRLEMIAELFLEHARQAHYVYIVEAPDAVLTRGDVNWPKGGRAGFLWGGTAFAAQRRKA